MTIVAFWIAFSEENYGGGISDKGILSSWASAGSTQGPRAAGEQARRPPFHVTGKLRGRMDFRHPLKIANLDAEVAHLGLSSQPIGIVWVPRRSPLLLRQF